MLEGQLAALDEGRIRELFDRTFAFLALADVRPIGAAAREAAFTQVMNYFRQNLQEMQRIIQTEVDVSLEKDGYILSGKVDLLLGGDGKLELLWSYRIRGNELLKVVTLADPPIVRSPPPPPDEPSEGESGD